MTTAKRKKERRELAAAKRWWQGLEWTAGFWPRDRPTKEERALMKFPPMRAVVGEDDEIVLQVGGADYMGGWYVIRIRPRGSGNKIVVA